MGWASFEGREGSSKVELKDESGRGTMGTKSSASGADQMTKFQN